MTDTQLQEAVLDLCRLLHLRTGHQRPALTRDGRWVTAVAGDGKGFPDLVIVGAGGVLWREIKRDRNDPVTTEQAAWLADLIEAGQDAAVWRPADWRSGLIEAELKDLAHPSRRTRP